MAPNDKRFDLSTVHENFSMAICEEDDVELQLYLNSFAELNKFFSFLGSIFSFVSSELDEKMNILLKLQSDESAGQHYTTVKKMIDYEKNNSLLNKRDFTSGCRTLLRLHRGLDFIRDFLKSLGEIGDEESAGTACRQSYDRTLAKFHPFVVKTVAGVAMYTLPNRKQLLKKVCGEDEHIDRALELLPDTLQTTAVIYERIETLYKVHNLHELP